MSSTYATIVHPWTCVPVVGLCCTCADVGWCGVCRTLLRYVLPHGRSLPWPPPPHPTPTPTTTTTHHHHHRHHHHHHHHRRRRHHHHHHHHHTRQQLALVWDQLHEYLSSGNEEYKACAALNDERLCVLVEREMALGVSHHQQHHQNQHRLHHSTPGTSTPTSSSRGSSSTRSGQRRLPVSRLDSSTHVKSRAVARIV